MIIIDAINGLPALGARACTISTAKSRQPPPHNLALFHELRCKAVHDARKVLELRCKAEHSFANLTIISRGGARRPPREAATVSSAPQGRWWGKCATGVADGLPLDDVASAVEADSSSQGVTPHTIPLVHGGRHCGLLFLIPSPAVVRFCALKVLLRGQHDVPALHAAPRLRRWIGCAACSGSGVACRHGSREANELEA